MKPEEFAERIRGECLQAALHAYENAGMQGLCAEGRWEAAVDALQTLDLSPLWREFAIHLEIDGQVLIENGEHV